jgi:hypothetical protein
MLFAHMKQQFRFTRLKLRAAVIKGKTIVAAHKNMAYDLEKKL